MEKRTFIIAEAGVNHNGNTVLAEKMIKEAKAAGADAIKFQTFKTEQLISRFAPKAEYQKCQTGNNGSQKEMVKQLELSFDQFKRLKRVADEEGILFLSTPFDLESIDFLNTLQIPYWKIPSGEITNLPYLERIAETDKPIILSTGMSEMDEITNVLNFFIKHRYERKKITLLHCTTEYPTPVEHVNLAAMDTMRSYYKTRIGYSDHSEGIAVSIAAAARGAEVIEKHFTLDRTLPGPDHKASLMPEELKEMVKAIRIVDKSIGNGRKEPSIEEIKNRIAVRKSIVAKRPITQGELFSEDNITTKRPGNGLNPMRWYHILGTKAKRDYAEDELIEEWVGE